MSDAAVQVLRSKDGLTLGFTAALPLGSCITEEAAAADVTIVVDVSGSMRSPPTVVESTPSGHRSSKIEIAKTIFEDTVNGLLKASSACRINAVFFSSDVVYTATGIDATSLKGHSDYGFSRTGGTLIVAALQRVARDFSNSPELKGKWVIIISDGAVQDAVAEIERAIANPVFESISVVGVDAQETDSKLAGIVANAPFEAGSSRPPVLMAQSCAEGAQVADRLVHAHTAPSNITLQLSLTSGEHFAIPLHTYVNGQECTAAATLQLEAGATLDLAGSTARLISEKSVQAVSVFEMADEFVTDVHLLLLQRSGASRLDNGNIVSFGYDGQVRAQEIKSRLFLEFAPLVVDPSAEMTAVTASHRQILRLIEAKLDIRVAVLSRLSSNTMMKSASLCAIAASQINRATIKLADDFAAVEQELADLPEWSLTTVRIVIERSPNAAVSPLNGLFCRPGCFAQSEGIDQAVITTALTTGSSDALIGVVLVGEMPPMLTAATMVINYPVSGPPRLVELLRMLLRGTVINSSPLQGTRGWDWAICLAFLDSADFPTLASGPRAALFSAAVEVFRACKRHTVLKKELADKVVAGQAGSANNRRRLIEYSIAAYIHTNDRSSGKQSEVIPISLLPETAQGLIGDEIQRRMKRSMGGATPETIRALLFTTDIFTTPVDRPAAVVEGGAAVAPLANTNTSSFCYTLPPSGRGHATKLEPETIPRGDAASEHAHPHALAIAFRLGRQRMHRLVTDALTPTSARVLSVVHAVVLNQSASVDGAAASDVEVAPEFDEETLRRAAELQGEINDALLDVCGDAERNPVIRFVQGAVQFVPTLSVCTRPTFNSTLCALLLPTTDRSHGPLHALAVHGESLRVGRGQQLAAAVRNAAALSATRGLGEVWVRHNGPDFDIDCLPADARSVAYSSLTAAYTDGRISIPDLVTAMGSLLSVFTPSRAQQFRMFGATAGVFTLDGVLSMATDRVQKLLLDGDAFADTAITTWHRKTSHECIQRFWTGLADRIARRVADEPIGTGSAVPGCASRLCTRCRTE
jgi:hypothetical protein